MKRKHYSPSNNSNRRITDNELRSLWSFLSDDDDDDDSNDGDSPKNNQKASTSKSSAQRHDYPKNLALKSGNGFPRSSSPNEKEKDKDASMPPEADDIDKILDYKAEKTKLSVVNVKSILKNVIMNEDVVEMVCKTLQGKETDLSYEPKLTRSRIRELLNKNQPLASVCNLPLHTDLSPKPKPSKCQLLIDDVLSDDSSDEEYMPSDDLQSDDEYDDKVSTASTQSTSRSGNDKLVKKKKRKPPDDDNKDKDSNLKIASMKTSNRTDSRLTSISESDTDENCLKNTNTFDKSNMTDVIVKETICDRTRSKLSLSETPLEIIEQQFIPPDITCDMYDWNCDNEDWKNFLKEFTQPLDALPHLNETVDDVEADPEYNVLADEEQTADEDKEELRVDRAVQISRKELNNLMKELFEYSEMMSSIEKEKKDKERAKLLGRKVNFGKKKPEKNKKAGKSVEKSESVDTLFSSDQRLLLEQQLRQHVQLTTLHYLQTYKHPVLHYLAADLKTRLVELSALKTHLQISNLKSAINIVENWERIIEEDYNNFIIRFMESEIEKSDKSLEKQVLRVCKFPRSLMQLICDSDAFPYPLLLPSFPFYSYNLPEEFVPSEDILLVLGLSQFLRHVKDNKATYRMMSPMNYVNELIHIYMMPNHSAVRIMKHIRSQRVSRTMNPIKEFFASQKLPSLIHYVIPIMGPVQVKDQPQELLPHIWNDCIQEMNMKFIFPV